MHLQEWIDNKLAEIGKKLPELITKNPSGFACGFSTGYKGALLDLDRFLTKEENPEDMI